MDLDRNVFLEDFAHNSAALNLIFLNHLGAPGKLLAQASTIELLADKFSTTAFIDYCRKHKLVKELVITQLYRTKNIVVKFKDESEIYFSLVSNMVRKTFLCLDVKAIRKSAFINEYGMLVPEKQYHFEYMALKCQFNKDPLPERYSNYFAGLDINSRTIIFKYIQTRYNLIFNKLEDLYNPKPNTLLTILIGLRAEKSNTLFRMFLRSIELVGYKGFGRFTKRGIHVSPSPVHELQLPASGKKKPAGHAIF